MTDKKAKLHSQDIIDTVNNLSDEQFNRIKQSEIEHLENEDYSWMEEETKTENE